MSLLGKNYKESMKSSLKNLGKKTFGCPSCKRALRVPVRPGKTLRVTCPRCSGTFDISYKFGGLPTFSIIKQKLLGHFGKKTILLLLALIITLVAYSFSKGPSSKKDLLRENKNEFYQEV